MSAMTMHYSMSARDVMTGENVAGRLEAMKRAGVGNVWLDGFFFGRHESDPEQMVLAKRRLEEEGFETGVISLPVGHPGNSLNPDDPTLDLAISPAWRYRVNRAGEKEYFCACVEETMTRDNAKAAEIYAQMGFTRHFFDDDLRMGNWGDEIRGCFCDRCVEEFGRLLGLPITREALGKICLGQTGAEDVREKWVEYNCRKITSFMEKTRVPGMTSGIMVMHGGGRKHGVSIPDIRRAVPGCMFRVGELHFDDKSYLSPGGKESLVASVREHLRLIGDNPAYSESTVFPAAALSVDNLIDKIRLELSLGLRNIFLMSGSWFLSEPYWRGLARRRQELEELAL